MPFLTTDDGIRLWYQIEGPDKAPVVMLSHGLGTDISMWNAQMPTLLKHFRVLRHDTRGHGKSDLPPKPYQCDRLGRDVLAVLDHCGERRVHFCGLSMGGMLGMWLGREAPDRINRLVLSNTAARIGSAEMWSARIATVEKDGVEAVATGQIERWFSAKFRETSPDDVAAIAKVLRATRKEGYMGACGALRDMDQRDSIATIRAPTLMISGRLDPATPPSDGKFIVEHIPGAHYVELEAGHMSNIEKANDYTKAVVDFLTA